MVPQLRHVKRLAAQVQITGEPGHLLLPRQDGEAGRIGHRRHLVIADLLGHPIKGRSGEQFRAPGHLAQVG